METIVIQASYVVLAYFSCASNPLSSNGSLGQATKRFIEATHLQPFWSRRVQDADLDDEPASSD